VVRAVTKRSHSPITISITNRYHALQKTKIFKAEKLQLFVTKCNCTGYNSNETEKHVCNNYTAHHSTAQHSTAQHSTAQHSTAQHSTAQHSTAQHSTAHNTIQTT
jgi:hypothetical protein